MPPENWHLTLRFLGDSSPEQAARVSAEMQGSALPPAFELVLGGCGAFPRPARASVLWVGVREGAAPLRALAEAAEGAARRAGFPAETRPFSPHLTLSRVQPPRDLRPVIERAGGVEVRVPVREAVLYRSRLGGGPARYEAVRRFPLP